MVRLIKQPESYLVIAKNYYDVGASMFHFMILLLPGLLATEADTLRTTRLDEFLVYIRLWRPSTYTLEEVQEVIVDDSAAGLVAKVCIILLY